jgi:uncharacterized protein YfbU (UPF0304 family)
MPTSLSKSERLILLNQYEILQKLDPERAKDYAQRQEIVQSGYKSLYHELGELGDELPEDVYSETFATLDMFRDLKGSFEALSDKAGIDPAAVKFSGFDGNDDAGHYGLARFMIEGLGRWEGFRKTDLNSHANYLPRYRRMLSRYSERAKSPTKTVLTKQEILDIIGA